MALTADRQDQAFTAHILDLFSIAQQKYVTRFTGFLDMHQLALARRAAASHAYPNHSFFGGHPGGERVMLGVFAPYEEPDEAAFPIVPLTITFRAEDSIGHRDILGSLTGLEIRREAVGDILMGEGLAVCFATEAVAPVILNELTKVGRCGVTVAEGLPAELPALHHYSDMPVNVSALRLDCVVAALLRLSRGKAAQTVRSGAVFLNGAPEQEVSHMLCEGDVLSVRGYGKFLVAEVLSETKKGRLHLLCKKYV